MYFSYMIGHIFGQHQSRSSFFFHYKSTNTSKLQINIPGIILNRLLHSFIDCRLVVVCSNFALPKQYGKWRLLLPLRSQRKLSSALAPPSPHQLQAALVPRFYQFFTLRDGPLMSCFQMETACFELFPRLYLQYSLGISHYESCWLPSLSPMEVFLKGSAMVHFSPIVHEWGRYQYIWHSGRTTSCCITFPSFCIRVLQTT